MTQLPNGMNVLMKSNDWYCRRRLAAVFSVKIWFYLISSHVEWNAYTLRTHMHARFLSLSVRTHFRMKDTQFAQLLLLIRKLHHIATTHNKMKHNEKIKREIPKQWKSLMECKWANELGCACVWIYSHFVWKFGEIHFACRFDPKISDS